MKSLKKFFCNHRIAICLFLFIVIYNFVIGTKCTLWQSNLIHFPIYTVDYSVGLCSRLLIGAVYNLLMPTRDMFSVSAYCTVIALLMFLGIAVLLEKMILHFPEQYRLLSLFFAVIMLTGPASFSPHLYVLGYFDMYWIFVSVVFLFMISHPKLYYFIILLFPLLTIIHYGATVCYIPFMAIILLFKICYTQDASLKKRLWIVFSVSCVLSVVLTVYFIMFERSTLNYTHEEFVDFIKSRGATVTYYYEFSLYRDVLERPEKFTDFSIFEAQGDGLLSTLKYLIQQKVLSRVYAGGHTGTPAELAYAILMLCPVFGWLYYFFIKYFKENKGDRLKRFACLCSMGLVVVTLLVGQIGSTDTFRWLSNALLPFASVFFFVLYHEWEELMPDIRKSFSRIPVMYLVVFWAMYMLSATSKF